MDYIKELNYFSFNVDKENQLFVITIPLDLLLSPYHVYFSETDQEILVESDQIRKSEFGQTETHANLSFKVSKEGIIHVVGSTEMEHEKLLTKLQKRTNQAIATEEDKSNSIFDAVKNQSITDNDEKSVEQQNGSDNLYEDWESTNSNTISSENNTIIFIIVGVVAVIIIGIIIKLKKN